MKDKEKALMDYLAYKKTSVNYPKKLELYRYFVGMFLNDIKKPLKEFQEKDVIDFINNISKKYSVGSMNEIKIMLKSFIYWHFEDYPKRFRNLKQICRWQRKEKTYSPEQMLSKEEIEKLVQEESEPRWKAFLLLYFYGGFRPKEVCELEWESITFDREGAFIKTYCRKNGKSFEKYVPDNVVFYLKKIQHNNSKYVFPTKRTNKHGIPVGDVPMTRSGVYQHLIPLAKRVLGKHVNPYILRHSIATILYNRDDLKDDDVAQQMGHSKAMKTTYNNLSIEKIRERMKKIYIKPEELPIEKKAEFEEKIKKQDERITRLRELTEIQNKFNALIMKQLAGKKLDRDETQQLVNIYNTLSKMNGEKGEAKLI